MVQSSYMWADEVSEIVDGEVFLNETKVKLKARNAENYDRGV